MARRWLSYFRVTKKVLTEVLIKEKRIAFKHNIFVSKQKVENESGYFKQSQVFSLCENKTSKTWFSDNFKRFKTNIL